MKQFLEKVESLSMPGRIFLIVALLCDIYSLLSGNVFKSFMNMLFFLAFNLFIYFICFMNHDHLDT